MSNCIQTLVLTKFSRSLFLRPSNVAVMRVARHVRHVSARGASASFHVTIRTIYTDDVSLNPREFFLKLVRNTMLTLPNKKAVSSRPKQ